MSTHSTDFTALAVQIGKCVSSVNNAERHDLQNLWDSSEFSAQIRKAQAMFRKVVPPGAASLVDELITERSREACSK